MSDIKKYNIFILISTLARNIIEVFSAVILYDMGYNLKDILLFYSILYGVGIIVNTLSIYLGKIIKQKNILILSTLIYGYCFYFLSKMDHTINNLIIFSILLSIGSYMYHVMRHYFALKILPQDNRKEVGNILIWSYLAIIISSYLGGYITSNWGLEITVIIVIVLSLIGIIPIMKLNNKENKKKIDFHYQGIHKQKISFFIIEQFKVIFLSLQPLYLYIYTQSNIEYIGIFNAILGIAAIIFIYFISRKVNIDKYFWFLNILFCLVLIFKLNTINQTLLLIIAFLEGIFTKMYEMISSVNLYSKDYQEVNSYLILVEFIFCSVRSIICLTFYFLIPDIKIMLYICILGILISGFIKRPNTP